MKDRYKNWRKASRSDGGNACVEVSFDQRETLGLIGVRDSKLGDRSPVLEYTLPEWAAFTDGVRQGEFE